MEEAENVNYTNRLLYYFIQQYKHIRYLDYQVGKITHNPYHCSYQEYKIWAW